jgi:hypothetical protein
VLRCSNSEHKPPSGVFEKHPLQDKGRTFMKSLTLIIALVAFLAASTGAIAGADRTFELITIAQTEAVANQKKLDTQLKAVQDEAAKLLAQTKKDKAKPPKKAK